METTIGEAIKMRLEGMGMSKAELARRLHMSPANVHKIFKRPSPDIELLKRISAVLSYDFISHHVHFMASGAPAGMALHAVPFAPDVRFTPELRNKMRLMARTCQELARENAGKPASHLLQELDFAIDLLNDIKTDMLSKNPGNYYDETRRVAERQASEQSGGSPQEETEQAADGETVR